MGGSEGEKSFSECEIRKDRSNKGSSYAGSVMNEDRLNYKEIDKLKRWIMEIEKEDRKNNVIKELGKKKR